MIKDEDIQPGRRIRLSGNITDVDDDGLIYVELDGCFSPSAFDVEEVRAGDMIYDPIPEGSAMTDHMTPVEAMNSALGAWIGRKYDFRSGEEVVAHLRARGLTIAPIEPTDAIIEAMARAIVPDRNLDWPALDKARRAYKALIKEAGRD